MSHKLLQPRPTPPLELQVSSIKKTDLPPFSYYDLFQTDADQDLFIHVDRGSVNDAVVLRLRHGDMDPTLYSAPPEIQAKTHFRRFFVTPAGSLSMLLQSNSGDGSLVLPFSNDGTANAPIPLQLAPSAFVEDFATFETGNIAAAGYYGEHAPTALRGKSFVAIFDSSGKQVRDLKGTLPGVDLATVFSKMHAGAAAVGADDNLYLLHQSEILIISPAGKLLRTIRFSLPDSDFIPRQLLISGGYAAISLYKSTKKGLAELELLVIDLDKGDIFRTYKVPPEVENVVAGFSRNEGFTFLALDPSSQRFNLVTMALR